MTDCKMVAMGRRLSGSEWEQTLMRVDGDGL